MSSGACEVCGLNGVAIDKSSIVLLTSCGTDGSKLFIWPLRVSDYLLIFGKDKEAGNWSLKQDHTQKSF